MDFFLATILLAALLIGYAYMKGGIDFSAVFASGIVGIVVLIALRGEWKWIYLILTFFIIGNLITKYKMRVKVEEGVAEGRRSIGNVFGNGGSAMLFSVLYYVTGDPILILGFLGAMATAAADTFATEVGEAHDKEPRLITTLKKTKVGTNGAVSPYGTFAAILGAGIISFIAMLLSGSTNLLLIGILAGFLGCNIDSFLGATIEEKGMDKHMTNFLATSLAGLIAIILGGMI